MAKISKTETFDPISLWGEISFEDAKLSKGDDGLPKGRAVIKGIVTCDVLDKDNETIDQNGLIWDFFTASGKITDGHPYSRDRVVGDPIEVSKATINGSIPAHVLKASLLMDLPRAKNIYQMHKAMTTGDGKGKGLGFSIEGHALARDPNNPNRILKAIVTSVAIDAQPKNPYAYMEPIAAGMTNHFQAAVMGEASHSPAHVAWLIDQHLKEPARIRLGLMKGLSNEDLMILRVLKKNPSLSLADGRRVLPTLLRGVKQ